MAIIIEENTKQVIYSEATQHDFECAIRTANILRLKGEWFERVETPEGANLISRSKTKGSFTKIKFNEIEQEMIVNFSN